MNMNSDYQSSNALVSNLVIDDESNSIQKIGAGSQAHLIRPSVYSGAAESVKSPQMMGERFDNRAKDHDFSRSLIEFPQDGIFLVDNANMDDRQASERNFAYGLLRVSHSQLS